MPKYLRRPTRLGDRSLFKVGRMKNGVISVDPAPISS